MAKKKSKKDPYAKREAKKYENPIPSREFIMQILEEFGKPMRFDRIVMELGLSKPEELQAIDFRLRAMLRDGQLMEDRRGRLCLVNKLELVKGSVMGHPEGYGFVIPEDGSDDLYLSPRQMQQVMHGDRVLVREQRRDRRGRREGMIYEVIERNTHEIVGRLFIEQGVNFVEPDNKRIPKDIFIPNDQLSGAQHGQIVVVKIIAHPTSKSRPVGQVVEVLGDHMAPGMEIDIALRAHDLPHTWPDEVIAEAETFSEQVDAAEIKNRTDLRNINFVTIDGEDARDFDDAVYATPKKGGGWTLYVAIADVSHYVAIGSALDAEAARRGNSVYFPERVIPMLPEVLSNGLCSLNPKVDRLCMVCEMSISAKGRLTRYRFYDAVMHSKARLTYTQVAAMLVDKDAALRKDFDFIVPNLEHLYDLFHVLHQARQARGAIEFETTETRIVFGDNKKIERIEPTVRNDAHRLIEECMLMANVAAAQFLNENHLPGLYRIHAAPSEDKMEELREFLGQLGLVLKGGRKPKPKDFAELLIAIKERPDFHLIQMVMLRSLKQAIYSPDNIGHFGLAFPNYAHFTSPIRRYPDLILHRAIRHVISHQDIDEYHYDHNSIEKLGQHCSMTERRADEATRDAVDWLKCEYMLDHVGATYRGIVSTVTNFGIFVELKDIYVEGLVHITALRDDYYSYDTVSHCLRGERTGVTYRIGDELDVLVAKVNLDDRKIDFVLP